MKPKTAILITDGINCDQELQQAFIRAGSNAEKVLVEDIRRNKKRLSSYQILAIPGGFSYGDDVLSGKIFANELLFTLRERIEAFLSKDKLVLGICNGFQVLIRAGLLPWRMNPSEDVSLVYNDSEHFECRWIQVRVRVSKCIFTRGLKGQIFDVPVAHGEGKFIVKSRDILNKLFNNHQVCFQYADKNKNPALKYPENPNGSLYAIAGVCDKKGKILGMMPHPERNIFLYQHPHWRTYGFVYKSWLPFFQNAVTYFS